MITIIRQNYIHTKADIVTHGITMPCDNVICTIYSKPGYVYSKINYIQIL